MAIGDMAVLMSLSVVSSVHCCIVISGTDPPLSTFISHSPALRTGNSTATAPLTGNRASKPTAEQDTRSSRRMGTLP